MARAGGIESSLGTLDPSDDGFGFAIYRYPEKPEGIYEIDLVKHGFKWSPFKFYRRQFNRKNTLGGRRWELRLKIERRFDVQPVSDTHYAYVIVTLRAADPKSKLPIYDQLVVEMNRLGWGAENLQIEDRGRY